MDGHKLGSQVIKAHTTALSEAMSALEEPLPMLTTNAAFMQVLTSQEQTPKSCQVNGNTKLDPAYQLKSEITSGWQDISSKDVQKTST